ncbi:hypothetical protein BC941DRAFT_441007 [Chlamydoabsidia padenii]|nr:hypothetical protein BC941DRAFT_441007 [Chlamydoabsidia padenii]
MVKMDRYRRYLLKVNDAHEFHSTEYQKNQTYRSFIIKNITNPVFEKLSLKDLLDQPWKRMTAYTLLLRDIRNHTSPDHPDFGPLTDAFTQINTIASVRDDVPTILATKSHDLYLSIRKAPCHLIKQSRSLITHLDAVEINRITGKISRHVTIFLFCDKIMVASRSSNAKGADICDMSSGTSPLTNMHKKKKGHDFKFCGWVGIEHIDLFHGPSDLPGAIIIRASSDFQDSITEMGYEKYFQKGARIFAYQTEPARQTLPRFMDDKNAFVDTFYKTQAVSRQYGNQDATFYRSWNNVNVYSNVYDHETYTKTEIKNNVAAILLEKESEIDIPSLLTSSRSLPWIVALVRPDSQGLKLNIWTRVPLSCLHEQQRSASSSTDHSTTNDKKQLDFATVFWNNVIQCEKKLRCSSTYRLMVESLEEQETQRPPRSRSRTSMSRSTSVSNISKFFSRSRSQSPSSASSQVVPTSSRSTPSQQQQQSDDPSRQRRPRSHSMSNDPTASSSVTKSKPTTTRRRKLSFDASFFKIDIKTPSNTNNATSSSSSSSSSVSSSSAATIQQQPAKLLQPKRHSPPPQQLSHSSIRPSSYSQHRRQSVSTTPIPVPSTSYSPPPMMHPTELPSQTIYQSSPQAHRANGHASNTPPPMTTDPGKQRQLIEKLDAMYHDMAGIGRTKEQQSRHTSDPLMARPPSRTSTASPTSPVSMTLPSFASFYHEGGFGTSSSRSSSYTNTFSSHASQSSRSSLSLEEMDPFKGYGGPSPRLMNTDMMNSSGNHLHHDEDDEITRKVMSDLAANGHKKWATTQKSLLSHYTSSIEFKKQQPTFNGTPTATMSMPALVSMEKEPALDHVATAVDHCTYQVGSKWQFLMDKQKMLGHQVNRVSDRLPFKDADADMLNEVYRDTMDETSNFFNKINTELKEISAIVNAYRQGYQQHQQRRNSTIDTSSHEADVLLKRKLKEVQLERDYWHRRASELTTQVNEYVLKQ